MARPRTFDIDQVLDSAIGLFREHGYEGTSAAMLVDAMGIGRQSLYDSFGDKWQLYLAAVRRYSAAEIHAHVAALRSAPRAIDGLHAMVARVVEEADAPCLGVGSTCEFGDSQPELSEIRNNAGQLLLGAVAGRIREAQADGDIAPDLDPAHIAGFFAASFAGIRVAARGGADAALLRLLGDLLFRALR